MADKITEILEKELKARDMREAVKAIHYLLDNGMITETHHIDNRENVNTTEDIAKELYNEYLNTNINNWYLKKEL